MDVATHLLAGISVGILANDLLGTTDTPLGTLIVVAASSASLTVDVDYLAKAVSLEAAWKYHRALTHSLSAIALISALIAGALSALEFVRQTSGENSHTLGFSNPFVPLFTTALCSSLLHIFLDACTPFPIKPFHPFSSTPCSLRLVYLVDPVFGAIFMSMVLFDLVPLGFGLLCLYLALVVCSKRWALQKVGNLGIALPIPLRPWKWLVVVPHGNSYQLGSVSPRRVIDWFEADVISTSALDITPEDCSKAVETARSNPTVRAFLQIALFPRFEFRPAMPTDSGRERVTLIIDDVQWWTMNRYRIMALCVEFESDWSVTRVSETSKFARGPLGLPEPLPLRKIT